MAEESFATVPFDRTIEQAIMSLRKGAHLLKCTRRGKPKFCPFRLSTDEKFLIWYSGKKENQLRLSTVTKITPGQKTANFQRQLQPERECQSFSLIYANGERSLDLICKDKVQADTWFVGLKAIISGCHNSKPHNGLRSRRGTQTCLNSPVGYIRRKHNLGLMEDATEFSQVRSLCGSPTLSLSERCFSDGLSYSLDSFYSSESSILQMQNVMDVTVSNSPYVEQDTLKKKRANQIQKNVPHWFVAPTNGSPQIEKDGILKDVMIWGEGMEGGPIGGEINRFSNHSSMQVDALLPKLLESTMMLDVRSISLGGKHAALVTKQGEVYCWGEGNGGRLGHKVNMDVKCPKVVESLNGIHVKSVACGEYQTCALTHSGELYTWGFNNYSVDLVGEEQARSQWLPRKLFGPLDGVSISNVACGDWHMAIVSTSGQLFTYGDGTFGVLGHGNLQSITQPKEVEALKGLWVKSVACGPWHTAAIVEIIVDRTKFNTTGGKLFTWGDGDKGRLGHADRERKLLPTCVAQLVDHDFVQVSCGRMLTVGLTNLGAVYTMGSVVHGQLGNPMAKDKSITIVEAKLKEEFVKEISSGSYHIAVLTARGSVYTWGKGANGQLGLGDIEDRNSPTLVESLRDRHVESIACGSSFTAAICLHKSISIGDQSACSGCRMSFGLKRKKHNCYNCGLLFCSACSNKKAINASLAPNKSKPSRVCDPCFNNLQRTTHSNRLLTLENGSPRLQLTSKKALYDKKEDRVEVALKADQRLSVRQSCNAEIQYGERKTIKSIGEKQQHIESVSSLSLELPRWGQVTCPVLFETYCSKNSMGLLTSSKTQLYSVQQARLQKSPQESKSTNSNAINGGKNMSESDMMLTEEVQRLRAEARSLETKCLIGNQKIQECQQKIEEAWSVAKEEAAKCKAAKEVIKALALRLHTMSKKASSGVESKDGVDANLPQLTTMYRHTPTLEGPMFVATHLPLKDGLPEDRLVDSPCKSPFVSSDTIKSILGREVGHYDTRSVEDSNAATKESPRNGTKASKTEWVEQYEPGVYITFTILPSGQKGLKRVRFSRKRFAEKEAERWWEENQVIVYQKYGIEGYIKSNQNLLKG